VNGVLDVRVANGRVTHLATASPVSAKVLPGPTLLVVGSAAGLLEGDRVDMVVMLGPGSTLVVRTVAATLAHACRGGGETVVELRAEVAAGARLAWVPEPLVAHAGCRHRSSARLDLAPGAAAVWAEALTLGRHGETAGDVELRLDADLGGRPLLRDGVRVGTGAPGSDGPAVLDGSRHVGTVALLGLRPNVEDPSVLSLAGPGAVARACAPDGAALERRLAPARRSFLDQLFSSEAKSHVA
jgi:urease accessory protein